MPRECLVTLRVCRVWVGERCQGPYGIGFVSVWWCGCGSCVGGGGGVDCSDGGDEDGSVDGSGGNSGVGDGGESGMYRSGGGGRNGGSVVHRSVGGGLCGSG